MEVGASRLFLSVEMFIHRRYIGIIDGEKMRMKEQNMTHSMQLTPSPFQMIKEGTKTIELRLFDEKRRKIQIGDIIEFSNTETGEKIGAKVSAQYVFDSFESLYKELSLLECGYTEADIETASPDDMNVYYSKDNQQKYGVVGIRIALLCGT